MPAPHQSDAQNYEIILQETGLPVIRRPEWCNVSFGQKFQADFTVLGENILISRPFGDVDLKNARQAFDLGYQIIRQYIAEDTPYILIEDYSRFHGASLDARNPGRT